MAGGSNPRQKMINLMYLVLIAMLALNVDTKVLKKFLLINQSFEATNAEKVSDNSRKIEVFIFDFDKNIYDMQIEISVIKKIRNQEFYDSVDIMKTQIKKDIININEVLER